MVLNDHCTHILFFRKHCFDKPVTIYMFNDYVPRKLNLYCQVYMSQSAPARGQRTRSVDHNSTWQEHTAHFYTKERGQHSLAVSLAQ